MLVKLKNDDEVIFLPNLLKDSKTLGDPIVKVDMFWFGTRSINGFVTDNTSMKIFPILQKIYWDDKRNQTKKDMSLQYTHRYYSYILLNGEYKLTYFGRSIKEKITSESDPKHWNYDDYKFNIKIKQTHGFPNYEDCHFSLYKHNKSFSTDFLNTKTQYIEDIVESQYWTENHNYDKLMLFFKENNIDTKPIKEITTKQRELKLERILGK